MNFNQHSTLIVVLLTLLTLFINIYLGYIKIVNSTRAPEDSKVIGKSNNYASTLKENEHRANRILLNNLENVLIFIITFLVFPLSLNDISQDLFLGCGWIFLVCRFGHTYTFIKKIQPWRTIFYTIGLIAQLVLLGDVVISAF